jgi:hypothetical protein
MGKRYGAVKTLKNNLKFAADVVQDVITTETIDAIDSTADVLGAQTTIDLLNSRIAELETQFNAIIDAQNARISELEAFASSLQGN